ncbi:MAG: T9SS type A sorting domain-containing protein [Saprospiraceae bacterium]|nr:T9SS type A sorting domain-containing protein [Saprospiraceae bacterium]
MFPNPFRDYLVIEGHPAPARLRIELYDLSGRLQLNRQLDDQATLTLPRLSPGLYLYRIWEGSNLLQSGKLVGR